MSWKLQWLAYQTNLEAEYARNFWILFDAPMACDKQDEKIELTFKTVALAHPQKYSPANYILYQN